MDLDELTLKRLDENGYRVYNCPMCGQGEVFVEDSVFYGRCDTCQATVIDYKPAPHQVEFHKSSAQYRLNIGGYGSGKTTSGAAEVSIHAMSTPNGRTLITSQSLQQVREAVLPELEKFLAPWLLAKKPVMTPLPKYELKNGHKIIVYASDNEEKIRSLNLTAFWIIEASGVDLKIFEQLQTRLRNKAAIVKDSMGVEISHNFMGIIESNPEEGWIRDEFLLRSSVIKASKSVDTSAYEKLRTKKAEKSYHTFLSSTVDNPYLHKDFIPNMCVGKSERWIRKYVYSYLEVKEGIVYPEFMDSLVDPFDIPDNWLRIFGFDKGWTDATTLVCIAIDPYKNIGYIYDEYYELQKPITYHATKIKEKMFGLKFYKPIQADPSVRNANDKDGVSYKDYFMNVSGVHLEPANNSILDGIERVRDFYYTGKLKTFTSCVHLKEEAQNYIWSQAKSHEGKDVPVDRFNHLMDALRYTVMGLPVNLEDVYIGTNFKSSDKSTLINRLQPDSEMSDFSDTDGDGGVYGLGYYNL